MAFNVMKLCCICALLTQTMITPEIGYARLAALFICFTVCLSVSEKHYSKSYEQIAMKFYGDI